MMVTNVFAGLYHSLFVMSDGSLWAMGQNGNGQLGDGTFNTNGLNWPEEIITSNVVSAACGYYHSLFLKSDGSLWGMGYSRYGELGDGSFSGVAPYGTNRAELVVAGGVTAISAGAYHSLFLKSDGSLWAMGRNNYGQLGDGTTNNASTPEQIVSSGVVAMKAGAFHSLFIKSDGSLWAVGNNQYGQLGDGTTGNRMVPVQIVSSGVAAVSAGNAHTAFVKSDGSLWTMGWNYYRQLGDGTSNSTNRPEQIVLSDVVSVQAGEYHNLFLKSDGSLWGFGFDFYGQLGDGKTGVAASRPEQIVSRDVVRIATGGYHTLFGKTDGSLWGMGRNDYGALGDGFTNSFCSIPEQLVPAPQPLLSGTMLWGTNMQIKGTCQLGGYYCLLASTNLASPSSQWERLSTNLIAARGWNNYSATVSNLVGARFYRLVSE
jgi:alpha-tubulin suppressor-like RCC1 family protein